MEEKVLPSEKLKDIYESIEWLWCYRDFKLGEKDLDSKSTEDRFGISSYPQLQFVNPFSSEIIDYAPRDAEGLVEAAKKAMEKVKAPEGRQDELRDKMKKAKELLKEGKKKDAVELLKELSAANDVWEYFAEARETLAELKEYSAPKLPDAGELEDPSPERRVEVLKFYAENFPKVAFEKKALDCLKDSDGLVRHAALEYVIKGKAAELAKKYDELLRDPLDSIKYAVLAYLKENGNRKDHLTLLKYGNDLSAGKIVSNNPNVVTIRLVEVFEKNGDKQCLTYLAGMMDPPNPRNGLTKVLGRAIVAIAERNPDKATAEAVLELLPKSSDAYGGRITEEDLLKLGVTPVYTGLSSMLGTSKEVPKSWKKQDMEDAKTFWREAIRKNFEE